jgi:hypothetical protein
MNKLLAIVATLTSVVLLTSNASCNEWVTLPNGSAGIEQNGTIVVVRCDTSGEKALHADSRGLILILLSEPRAAWKEDTEVEVTTASDNGSHTIGVSHGIVLSPTVIMLKNDATWELNVMGNAKKTFTMTAGGYAREFSATKLRETIAPVLEKCGDHW